MLPRIVLTLVQIAAAWQLAPQARSLIPAKFGALDVFLLAVVVAIIVWLTGHIGALVLKDTPAPSAATLTAVLIGALIMAALALVPPITAAVSGVTGSRLPTLAYPLIGAIVGYLSRR
jgi:hypothetical protein